jgi:hypothetical protein
MEGAEKVFLNVWEHGPEIIQRLNITACSHCFGGINSPDLSVEQQHKQTSMKTATSGTLVPLGLVPKKLEDQDDCEL